jgi:hypothetical protein
MLSLRPIRTAPAMPLLPVGGPAEVSTALDGDGHAAEHAEGGALRRRPGVPVLLHHGFLVDFNSLWHRSGVVRRLVGDGLEVVLIVEHFLREAGDAHAFGHDAVLLARADLRRYAVR